MTRIDFPSHASRPTRVGPAQASEPPPALLFERLLQRYERRFGAMPPVNVGDVEDVNRLMRRALAGGTGGTKH